MSKQVENQIPTPPTTPLKTVKPAEPFVQVVNGVGVQAWPTPPTEQVTNMGPPAK